MPPKKAAKDKKEDAKVEPKVEAVKEVEPKKPAKGKAAKETKQAEANTSKNKKDVAPETEDKPKEEEIQPATRRSARGKAADKAVEADSKKENSKDTKVVPEPTKNQKDEKRKASKSPESGKKATGKKQKGKAEPEKTDPEPKEESKKASVGKQEKGSAKKSVEKAEVEEPAEKIEEEPKKRATRGRSAKAAAAEIEEEEKPEPVAKKAPAKGKNADKKEESKSAKKVDKKTDTEMAEETNDAEAEAENGESNAAIDDHFDVKNCQVLSNAGKTYSCYLTQIGEEEDEEQKPVKFYIIQILKSVNEKNVFYAWSRWGKGTSKGQVNKKKLTSLKNAIAEYDSKYRDKTVKGNYVEIDHIIKKNESDDLKAVDLTSKKSNLGPEMFELLKIFFDKSVIDEQLKEFGYDSNKLQLSKLTKNSFQRAYEILKEIEEALISNNRKSLHILFSEFYGTIPFDLGTEKIIVHSIDTEEKLKKKTEILQSLQRMHVTLGLIEEASKVKDENPVDNCYSKLKAKIQLLDKKSTDYELILECIQNTHSSTHKQFSLEVLDAFTVDREGEAEKYNNKLHNKMLLWHGSHLHEYGSIFKNGLELPSKKAPDSSFPFGKGVYFTDTASKAAIQCNASRTNNIGLLLLCEVALGECNELYFADHHAHDLPKGKNSTKGMGNQAPLTSGFKKLGDVIVPCGKESSTEIPQGSLLFNEYVVYDISQIKLRYLVKTKFNYI